MAGRHGRREPGPDDPLEAEKAEADRLLQHWQAAKKRPDATDDQKIDAFFDWWKEGR